MSKIFFTSDLHFGHKNVIRFDNRPFASIEEMDREIVERWNRKVAADDTVYVLGDVSWYNLEKTRLLVESLNGHKVLVCGNHDRISTANPCGFESIVKYKELNLPGNAYVVLSHYPIPLFNRHHYGAYMLYGHVHNSHEWNIVESWKADMQRLDIKCNLYNVGTMIWNYEPVTLDEIIADQRFQPQNPEFDGME